MTGATHANSAPNTYDETPYPDLSYAQTHPDRLGMLGHILGLPTAPVDQCSVLELGCAGGGNLLPMAANLPGSRFVGIDYSAHQIEIGQRRLAAFPLPNLTLRTVDVTDPRAAQKLRERNGGPFHYIIAHGLYSWVARPVRDAMFALAKELLAPNGVLYVSYNTLPGWNITRTVREAMLFHARNADSPQAKSDQARAMVDFLARHIPDQHEAYRAIFQRYHAMLSAGMKGAEAAFLLHDELEDVNEPVYFQDFVAHAAGFGLQYFVETELANVLPHAFGETVMQELQQMASTAVELEQYMDFLRNRMFRQSLLCHAEHAPTRMLRPEPIMDLIVRSEATAQPGIGENGAITFRAPDNAALTTDHPVSQAALRVLGTAWPRAFSFPDLMDAAYTQLGRRPAPDDPRGQQDRLLVAANLLRGHGHSARLAGLHRMQPPLATDFSKLVHGVPSARFEARTRSAVTNLWHERVQLDEPKRQLLLLLDGATPPQQLESLWRLALRQSPRVPRDSAAQAKLAKLSMDAELAWLARASLLQHPDQD